MNELELLSKLVTYKTVYKKYNEFDKCFDFIEEYLKDSKSKLYIKKYKHNNDKMILISNSVGCQYDIVFCGHIDVVPGESKLFRPRIINNRLYGRGSIDMKGHVAIMINMMKEIDNSKKIALVLTSDEERGGFNGLPYLIENKYINTKLAIVPDGGNNFELVAEEKGVLQLRVISEGKEAHSSRPFDGVNAIKKLTDLYSHLLKKYPLPKKEKDYRSSINLGIIKGGDALNKVPNKAYMELDIRHINSDKKEDFINLIQGFDSTLKIKVLAEGYSFFTDLDNEYIKKYICCSEKVLKRKVKIKRCESSGDARFFSKNNIPCVIMNAEGGNIHGKNEYIEINSIEKLKEIYKKIIKEI